MERSQQTDEMQFWVTVDLTSHELSSQLDEWQFFYNWQRPHSALRGLTPINCYCELIEVTLTQLRSWRFGRYLSNGVDQLKFIQKVETMSAMFTAYHSAPCSLFPTLRVALVSGPSCSVSVSFVGFVSRQPLPLVSGSPAR